MLEKNLESGFRHDNVLQKSARQSKLSQQKINPNEQLKSNSKS